MRLAFWLTTAILIVTAACDSGGASRPPTSAPPNLRIVLHDAPSDDADQVWVTFDEVSVHGAGSGWIVVDDRAHTVDLKTLAGGVAQVLGVATLPPGKYTQIRLHVRNSHVVVGAVEYALTIPSGDTSGIKLNQVFDVPTCGEVELELDWDLHAQLREHQGAWELRPTIHVDAHEPDQTGCCGDALCVGGVCTNDVCEPGGGEQLIVHEGTHERVRGYYGQDGLSVSFDMQESAAGTTIAIASATGEPLVDVTWQGDQFTTSLFGGGLVSTVDLAILRESERLGELPAGDAGAFSLEHAFTTTGDRSLADALIARPEYALLPWLSRSLGAAGFTGYDYPMTVPLHRMAMQATNDLGIDLPPLSAKPTGPADAACLDLRSDPNHDQCFGMCGKLCGCWDWVCGDCCCHDGCVTHDKTCGGCKWYKPWNCVLCYTGLSFLVGLCGSCGPTVPDPVYEPSCKGLGAACEEDYDCCGADNGVDEASPRFREVSCHFDASGNGTCRREGAPVPAVCGNHVCEEPESCASCPGDCGPCANECNNNGTCDGYPEDCGTCAGDCPCAGGTHCQGRTCVPDTGPTCGDGVCGGGESCGSCPADCGACAPICGDGVCNGFESCSSCPGDCGACPPGCGDGVCSGEDCHTCPDDCGSCAPICGDGVCTGFESCSSCPADCGSCGPACGDGVCNGSETCGSCPGDCGTCSAGCGDGVCAPVIEDNCNCPGDCPPVCGNGTCDCEETCATCPSECGSCGAVCGDGVCTPVVEDCGNCPGDCPCWMPGTTCVGGQCHTFCGNGTCEPVIEDNCNCPSDCPPVCGNGTCDCEESCFSCPSECGSCVLCGDGSCDPPEDGCICPSDCGACMP